MPKPPVDLVKLQQNIDNVEKNGTLKNQNALYEAVAATKWAISNGISQSRIYQTIAQSLDTPNPIRMKTKAARIRKGGISEKTADHTPSPALVVEETMSDGESVKRPFAPVRRPNESTDQENERLRIENEDLRIRFAVYHREGNEIFDANPRSVVKCAANGNATKVKTCPEADAPYAAMLDGLSSAQQVIASYRDYAENHALNPDDKRRVKEATVVLQAFFNATALSGLALKTT